jgi:amino acid transporter
MLPGSEWLSRIAPGGRSPRNAIVLIWALSCALVLGLPTLDIVTQISAVAGYLGYGGIMGAALWRASQPTAGSEPGERRALTRIIAAMALLWSLGVVGALTLTPTPVSGIRTLYLPALSTAVGLLLGAGIYLTTLRGRLLRGEAGPPRSPAPPTNP